MQLQYADCLCPVADPPQCAVLNTPPPCVCCWLAACSCRRNVLQTFRVVLQEGGTRGLWRGTGPTVVRLAFGAGINFVALENLKHFMLDVLPQGTGQLGFLQAAAVGGGWELPRLGRDASSREHCALHAAGCCCRSCTDVSSLHLLVECGQQHKANKTNPLLHLLAVFAAAAAACARGCGGCFCSWLAVCTQALHARCRQQSCHQSPWSRPVWSMGAPTT